MRQSRCDVLVHAVWGTWDREPCLTTAIAERVFAVMAAKCRELGCAPWAIGGVADHVHLLVRLDAMVPVARLIQEVKGSSSHFVTRELGRVGLFKWQGSYAAFSVSRSDVERVRDYVLCQPAHHARNETIVGWEPEPAKAGFATPGATSVAGCSRPPPLRR